MTKKVYFIETLKDNPQTEIRLSYKSAIVSNGYVELDPQDDVDMIRQWGAIIPELTTKKVVKKDGE